MTRIVDFAFAIAIIIAAVMLVTAMLPAEHLRGILPR